MKKTQRGRISNQISALRYSILSGIYYTLAKVRLEVM